MYTEHGKSRKVHIVLLAPDIKTVEEINRYLLSKGRMDYDGRPIFGKLPCRQLTADLKKISDSIEVIPAHVWTPYFGLFGSNSGFDSLEEAFGEQSKTYILLKQAFERSEDELLD